MDTFYTTLDVARKVGLPVHVLGYWLRKWNFTETLRVSGAKVFSAEKLIEIEEKVRVAKSLGAFTSRASGGKVFSAKKLVEIEEKIRTERSSGDPASQKCHLGGE